MTARVAASTSLEADSRGQQTVEGDPSPGYLIGKNMHLGAAIPAGSIQVKAIQGLQSGKGMPTELALISG